ncbi:MAG: hypothetical protein DMD26_14870 [Gemmatimonadetes bacterium]|nr:MAG: hypothetical protein DMD26_14870 [Gemmatimonadota bacterium]
MRRRFVLATAIILALLIWSVVLPNVSVIAGSFAHGLDDWRSFAASPADREALWSTLVISIGSVIAALIIGLPLAFLLGRFDFRGRRALSAVATLPAALPPLVGVIAFLFLYGESGVVTRTVQRALGLEHAPWSLTGLSAIIFVHAYTMYVYVFLFVAAGLERYDGTLDEAAAGLGATRARTLARITLPLLMPSIAGAMLLVFMSSLGSFSAPYIFGGGQRVLATQILVSKLNGSMGLAYVETTVLALAAVGALIALRGLERRRRYALAGKGKATRVAVRSPAARAIAPIAALVVVTFLVLPHAMVVLVSFARDGAWTTQIVPPEYTLDNFRRLVSDPELWRPITNSVGMSVLATAANVLVCFIAAYLIVLTRAPGRRLLQLLVVLPWAIPATAARGLGASWLLALRRVVLPAARPGLVAGTMLAAIAAVGEFVASVVLYTHANRPISIEILAQLRSLSFGTAAAYSVLLIALVLAITLGARLAEGRVERI